MRIQYLTFDCFGRDFLFFFITKLFFTHPHGPEIVLISYKSLCLAYAIFWWFFERNGGELYIFLEFIFFMFRIDLNSTHLIIKL